jgi:Mce-associated membrane protein
MSGDDSVSEMMAELAEAEAAEAEALAAAAEARARAAGDSGAAKPEAGRAPRRWQTVAVVLAALLVGAGVALTALMLWQHNQAAQQRAEDRRFVDAARDGVTALLSIDHTRAQADVQRVLDLSTGAFRDDFERSADDFVKTAVESKAVTKGIVNASALDTVDGDRAAVMVVATSQVTNANGANEDPRPFRMSVTVTRDGDTCKMSNVEFVP